MRFKTSHILFDPFSAAQSRCVLLVPIVQTLNIAHVDSTVLGDEAVFFTWGEVASLESGTLVLALVH